MNTPKALAYFERYKDEKKHILIAGGTGFIGRRLVTVLLAHGHDITILTRYAPLRRGGCETRVRYVTDLAQLENKTPLDVVINLAGEPLAGRRWTMVRKKLFLTSRLNVTNEIYHLIERLDRRPTVLINASAIGYYGPQGDELLAEDALAVDSFSHQLCDAWEASASKIEALDTRVCILRIGIVLGEEDGPLAELKIPFRFGVAMQICDGKQWMSWVHRDDVVSMMLYLMTNNLNGVVNGTAPKPVMNSGFTVLMTNHYRTFIRFAMPAWLLRLVVGEMADEILMTGQRVVPAKLLSNGFEFLYPELEEALAQLLACERY